MTHLFAFTHHADNGRPDCHEKPVNVLAVGDRVWSREDQRFERVIGTSHKGAARLIAYATGDVAKFDSDRLRVLVAIDPAAAEQWNDSPLDHLAVEWHDGGAA